MGAPTPRGSWNQSSSPPAMGEGMTAGAVLAALLVVAAPGLAAALLVRRPGEGDRPHDCLLYTSDAADEL